MAETGDSAPTGDELTELPAPTPRPWTASIPDADYSDSGVPSFDFVRDKIEQRALTADGATELAGLGTGQDLAAQDRKLADREKAAKDKLAELRKSLRGE